MGGRQPPIAMIVADQPLETQNQIWQQYQAPP
jgi:hypothetical protein